MKPIYLKISGIVCLFLFISFSSFSQGCVAIRSGCGANIGGGATLQQGQWETGTNFRYFHSYKHFRGKHEETHRVEEGSEVINDSFFLDMLLSYGVTDRLSINFVLPFVYHNRSSMYEHGGNPPNGLGERHETSASGLADIRVGASYWLLNPDKFSRTNFSLGLGVKLPSGNYRAEDTFFNPERTAHVDQSIQPGDGGFGATLDIQGYHALSGNLMVSTNFYYLMNPREKYNVTGFNGNRDFSVPDQYAARLGLLYMTSLHGLSLYAGGRIEGVPSSDLVGGDEGWRRPGYAISVEPGISYTIRNTSFNLTVPVAVERNRTQNAADKQSGGHGDAAFADYLINFGFSWRFGGKAAAPAVLDVPSEPASINQ